MEKAKLEKVYTKRKIILFLKNNTLIIFLIFLCILGYLLSNSFLTLNNIINLLRQMSLVGILSCGMTFCIIAGNLDLSLGSTLTLAAVLSILLQPISWIFATVVALIAGLLVGTTNGLIIGTLKSNTIIVTLGMMSVVQAIALHITGGGRYIAGDKDSPFSFIGRGYIWRIPVPVIIFIVIALFSYLLLNKTKFGKYVYCVGSNENMSWVAGIKVGNVKLGTLIIMGGFAAITGIILGSRLSGDRPYMGTLYLFDPIIAVILGGTSLKGGKGSIGNTIIGVIVIGVIANIFILLGIEYAIQQFVKGLILIVAILINIFFQKGEGVDE